MADYIDSAGIKLNAASDIIIEANKRGEVISARNLINNTEYVGGGVIVTKKSIKIRNISVSSTRTFALLVIDDNDILATEYISLSSGNEIEIDNLAVFPGNVFCIAVTIAVYNNISTNNCNYYKRDQLGTATQPYLYTYMIIDPDDMPVINIA